MRAIRLLTTTAGWTVTAVLAVSRSGSAVPAVNVAIIGAGAAGSSAAYYLSQFAAEAGVLVNLTVFERTERVGGRALTVNVYNNPLESTELGASVFIEKNHILWNATKRLDLPWKPADAKDGGLLAVWDGDQFVYESDSKGWEWWNLAKLFWRYGRAPYKTDRLMQKTVATFLKMYEKPWFPFRSLTQRAFELGLTQITAQTGQDFLRANGISEKYANDIVQASTRVNYASNLGDIHGLDTMVAMAAQGAKQIVGGNWRIFKGMIDESGASLLLNTSLTSIDLEDIRHPTLPHERFTLKTLATESEISEPASYPITFDKVILATPWQFADIAASDDVMQHPIDEIPYIKLHVTLFTSAYLISPSIYRWAPVSKVPSTILTTLADSDDHSPGGSHEGKAGFYSIQTRGRVTNPKTGREEFLYHIFSADEVTSDFLSNMLGVKISKPFTRPSNETDRADAAVVEPITWYHAHVFDSYPQASPKVTFQDPIIRAGLYYTSGMEPFISYMETSALMGMNVARLLVDDLAGASLASNGESSADVEEESGNQAALVGAKKDVAVSEL